MLSTRPSLEDLLANVKKMEKDKPQHREKVEYVCPVCNGTSLVDATMVFLRTACKECKSAENKARKRAARKPILSAKEREKKKFYADLKKSNSAIWLQDVEVYGQGRTERVNYSKLTAKDLKFKESTNV